MTYTPSLDADVWDLVQEFVETAVARCSGRTAYSDPELLQACARLAAWASADKRSLLTDKSVFAPRTIERFTAEGLTNYAPASRGNRRSMLLRMSEVILGDKAGRARLVALPASTPSEPYTASEVTRLRRWAERSPVQRRDQAMALVALALGGGLSTGEITAAKCADISQVGDAVFICVRGARSREIQIGIEWSSTVLAAGQAGEGDDWVFCPNRRGGGKNMVTNFIAAGGGSGPRPSVQRMRATWIVRHLQDGASAVQLMTEAGVRSMEALNRFVRYVDTAA